jgi:hypothetical protein
MVFGTHYVSRIANGGFNELLHLAYHIEEQADAAGIAAAAPGDADDMQNLRFSMQMLTPLQLLASARLWLGLAAAAGMIALAIRLRRYHDES